MVSNKNITQNINNNRGVAVHNPTVGVDPSIACEHGVKKGFYHDMIYLFIYKGFCCGCLLKEFQQDHYINSTHNNNNYYYYY